MVFIWFDSDLIGIVRISPGSVEFLGVPFGMDRGQIVWGNVQYEEA